MSEEERRKKEEKNKRILGLIIGIILILSTAGYAFMSFGDDNNGNSEKITYAGREFVQNSNGYWSFSYGNKDYETIYNPLMTQNVSVKINKDISSYSNSPLYFGINSQEDIANNGIYEIEKNLNGIYIKTQFSCIAENCTEDYSIKNCSNNVIIFRQIEENYSYITQDNNCIMIDYALGDEEKATDAFIFNILGIK